MIQSRQDLAEYCLRQLGHPVIQVNVSEEQVSDRIDDALQKYYEFHGDGSQRAYLKHQLTVDDTTNGYIPISDNIRNIS